LGRLGVALVPKVIAANDGRLEAPLALDIYETNYGMIYPRGTSLSDDVMALIDWLTTQSGRD
jgi:DNA-binding transcriptional LysR family regulator